MEILEILSQGNTYLIIKSQDLNIFAERIVQGLLASQPKSPTVLDVEQPISQPEAIKFLGKSRQTLIKYRKKGLIKGHVLGGRIYYLKSELLEAIDKST